MRHTVPYHSNSPSSPHLKLVIEHRRVTPEELGTSASKQDQLQQRGEDSQIQRNPCASSGGCQQSSKFPALQLSNCRWSRNAPATSEAVSKLAAGPRASMASAESALSPPYSPHASCLVRRVLFWLESRRVRPGVDCRV